MNAEVATRAFVKAEIDGLWQEIRQETKAEFSELKTNISALKTDLGR